VDRRFDLAAVADDSGVFQQTLDVALTKPRDALEIETGERLAKCFALAENCPPAQARLKTFETDLFEQAPIVGDRKSPFIVVISDIERIVAYPVAPTNDTDDARRVYDGTTIFRSHGSR